MNLLGRQTPVGPHTGNVDRFQDLLLHTLD